jgi:hypothetical protein
VAWTAVRGRGRRGRIFDRFAKTPAYRVRVPVEPVIRRGGEVHAALFPGRDLAGFVASTKDPALAAFWRSLKDGNDRFERTHRIPKPTLGDKGYVFR